MERHFIRLVSSDKDIRKKSRKLERETLEDLLKLYKNLKISHLEKLSDLDLSNCELVDITCGLKNLSLKKLNLSGNELARVPRCFYYGLELLEFLDISDNKIANFNIEPNCCESLKVLFLCSNRLKDIPQWIMNHRAIKLEELHYDFNKITSLRCIFGMTRNFWVTKLSLRNCIVRNEDCDFLKNCRYLEELDISNVNSCSVNRNIISSTDKLLFQPNWKFLCILKMNNLSLSVFPEGLNWLEGLVELHLTNNYLMWLPEDGLEFFVNLEVMNVSHNLISCIPEKLTWLVDLKVLNLSYNILESTSDFSTMKSLEILDLYSNKIEKLNHNHIGSNLKCLDLEMNFLDTMEWDYPPYEEMKYRLRKRIPEERQDGFLDVPSLRTQDSSSEISEDWDEEIRIRDLVTTSDNEWNGEAPSLPYIPINSIEKPSIYNDDVIFCDAD